MVTGTLVTRVIPGASPCRLELTGARSAARQASRATLGEAWHATPRESKW
jgi:hypothetical protein